MVGDHMTRLVLAGSSDLYTWCVTRDYEKLRAAGEVCLATRLLQRVSWRGMRSKEYEHIQVSASGLGPNQ